MSSPHSAPPFGTIALAGVGLAAALLIVIGPPRDRSAPRAPVAAASPASVAGGGFTLTSAAVELPGEDVDLPPGPHVDAVTANCTACHSPAMIVSQPALSSEQWAAEVEKMQKAYHAPVDPAAVPAIVDYLTGLSAMR